MQQYLFVPKTHSQCHSGIQVLFQYQMQVQFTLLPKTYIYLLSEMKAEPDLSLV